MIGLSILFVGGVALGADDFTDADWVNMGSGLNNYVESVAVAGSTVYVGGVFTTTGGHAASYIAQWDGTNWSALESGVNSDVAALAVSGGTLYVGGDFTTASGYPANYIAQWDGTNRSALGSGMDFSVLALAVSGADLYAGGSFTMAGSNPANGVARWNGSGWSALGSGVNGYVTALAVSDTNLYVGGSFTTAGGNPATNIAQWNGSSWSALGSGVSGYLEPPTEVHALTVWGTNLYAAGSFTNAGGVAANCVAQWNGITWSALGSGMAGSTNGNGPFVDALALAGGRLYAGGIFTAAGGNPAICIAQWDGTNWLALGSGVSGIGADALGPGIFRMAASATALYVGGDFRTAGTNACAYIAEAVLPVAPLVIVTGDGAFGFTNGGFGFDVSGQPGSSVVVQSTTDMSAPNWVSLQTNVLGGGQFYFLDSQPATNRARFYRAVMAL